EGNEVVIHFTDDGQGLNLNRIRDKAKNVGLLTDESYMSESDIVNLIFEPGFSTASEITELAGRGVGMDVVRSEAASLGGRVAVSSIEGQGAHFTIHLPLTLAVTQVVILNAAGKTFAVPSVLVEQVQQLKSAALAAAYNEGAIMWQGSRVPLHYLPSMLGSRDATPDTQQYTPILIMKSDNERVAIHVDQIIGNREVVVKNVGPQLARMIGIAGATVLGSGDIVLILNPVPLAQKLEHERARLPDTHVDSGNPEMGAVAEMVAAQAAPAQLEPVQGLRTHHIVMVVDDSLTVRRVTQRLLVREGYQVVLAKDGIDALEQLQSITPDVMLVDIEMPRMDGFDLTRNVRSDSRTHHIPIIMITSRTADKHRNYAMELGVNEYFGKPYREDDLMAAINGFVNKPSEVVS
ncbi:MAG: response regulator, partial [Burkholderiales bacterium]|nr:response regulator [Burkholderiales bacterium]